MAYRVACEMSATIAAVGVISGSLKAEHCAPSSAVPLIAFHGTSDSDVPYADEALSSPVAKPLAAASGLPPSIRFWSVVNGCTGLVLHAEAAHVTRATFTPCAKADLTLYTIDEGLHAWPGGAKDGSDGQEPTTEIRATDVMVRFFLRHTRR
jgi:polyhydroxybutyrate depolymerase